MWQKAATLLKGKLSKYFFILKYVYDTSVIFSSPYWTHVLLFNLDVTQYFLVFVARSCSIDISHILKFNVFKNSDGQ